MATRFYLPSTGAAPISPAFSTWSVTTGADILSCVTTRIGSSMTDKATGNLGNLGANSTVLSRMYVSAPLAAQTLGASTIKGTIRALESAANDNLDAMRLVVRIVSSDGSTFRSPTVYGPANSTVAEFDTALRAKRLATGGATSGVTISAGDRVVIEIGITNTGAGTSVNGTVNYGDNSATDLGDNETDVAANNPFVELAATLTFLRTGSATITEAGDTISAASKVALKAALAKTEASDTLSSATKVAIKASAAITEAGDTLSAAATIGDAAIVGSASITEEGDTISAAATVALEGAAAITEAGDTISAAATVVLAGAADIPEAGDTLSSAATLALVAAADITEADDTLSATGSALEPIAGAADITEDDDTLVAEATVTQPDPILNVIITDDDTHLITSEGDTLVWAEAEASGSGGGGGVSKNKRREREREEDEELVRVLGYALEFLSSHE